VFVFVLCLALRKPYFVRARQESYWWDLSGRSDSMHLGETSVCEFEFVNLMQDLLYKAVIFAGRSARMPTVSSELA